MNIGTQFVKVLVHGVYRRIMQVDVEAGFLLDLRPRCLGAGR